MKYRIPLFAFPRLTTVCLSALSCWIPLQGASLWNATSVNVFGGEIVTSGTTLTENSVNLSQSTSEGSSAALDYTYSGPLSSIYFGLGPSSVTVQSELEAFAQASLDEAKLKSLASVTNVSGHGPFGSGGGRIGLSVASLFGTSFEIDAESGENYIWDDTDASQALFNFQVSGSQEVSDELATAPGFLYREMFTTLSLVVMESGALELFSAGGSVADRIITSSSWILGETMGSFAGGTLPVVELSDDGLAEVEFGFNPEGDFDWYLSLSSFIWVDSAIAGGSIAQDFSHTVDVAYTGPVDSVTRSTKGLFPGTVAIQSAPRSVSDSGTSLGLLAFALAAVVGFRKRSV